MATETHIRGSLTSASDEVLARLAGCGSEPAVRAIDVRYRVPLHGLATSILRDEHEAHDVVQVTLLKALAALRTNCLRAPLGLWLFRIARNESISVLRRRRDDLGVDELAVPDHRAEDRAQAWERLLETFAHLQRLTEYQRSALILRTLAGLSYKEVAEALSTTPRAACQAVHVARATLHETVERSSGPGPDGHRRSIEQ